MTLTTLKINDYEILVSNNIINNLSDLIKPYLINENEVYIITDKNVYNIYRLKLAEVLPNIGLNWIVIRPGEKAKSYKNYINLSNELIKRGIKRNSLIISFGGGVVGDLAGFISSTLYRGINYIQIPTTLLSQVDSSIGSKTGINNKYGKNLIGAFYDPKLVIIDPLLLNTLPVREYNNGVAEIIKAGLIADAEIIELLEKNTTNKVSKDIIVKSLEVKQLIVMKDPYEKNIRKYLNLGHTLGHAVENNLGYGKIKHGEAVAHGILFSLEFSKKLNILEDDTLIKRVSDLLNKYNLINKSISYTKHFNQMFYDKKALNNGINYVLLKKIALPTIKLISRKDLYENFAK